MSATDPTRRHPRPTCLAQDVSGAWPRPSATIVAGRSDWARAAADSLARHLFGKTRATLPVVDPTPLAWSRLRHTDALVLGSAADNPLVVELRRRGLALGPGWMGPADLAVRTF